MRDAVLRVLGPAVLEGEDRERTAFLLGRVLRVMAGGAAGYALLVLLALPEQRQRLWIVVPVWIATLALSVTLRRGHVHLASLLTCFLLWLAFSAAALTGGGVRAPAGFGYLVLIVVAGLLLGRRSAEATALVSIASAAALFGAEAAGWFPRPAAPYSSLAVLVVQAVFFLAAGTFVGLANRGIGEALDRVRSGAADLERTNASLRNALAERDRLLAELRESERWLALALSGAGLTLWEYDLRTNELRYDRRTAETLGYVPEELARGFESWIERIQPADLEAAAHRFAAHARGDTPFYEAEHPLRTKEGQWRWVLSRGRIVEWNEDGSPHRMLGTYLDIEERRMAEEALRNTERRYRDLFENAPDMYLAVDAATGVVLDCNATLLRVTGYEKAEVVGHPVFELYDANCRAQAREAFEAFRAGRPVDERELQVRCKSGEAIWVALNATPIFDAEGRLAHSRSVWRDVTGRKRLEGERQRLQEKLKRSELLAAAGSLVTAVSHEVRNPLFGISATLDAFAARFGSRAEFGPYLETLRREVERLTRLMRDVLEYARPPALARSPSGLGEVIAQSIEACTEEARRAGVRLVSALPADPLVASVDRDRMRQVFQNVVQNAIQHSPPGAAVTVAAARVTEDGRTWLEGSVSDEGPGFGDGDLERVFEPFFSRREGGTGLGLAIARRIVDEHDGHISLQKGERGGAVVTVRLPLEAT